MTKAELSQLYYLNREIEAEKRGMSYGRFVGLGLDKEAQA